MLGSWGAQTAPKPPPESPSSRMVAGGIAGAHVCTYYMPKNLTQSNLGPRFHCLESNAKQSWPQPASSPFRASPQPGAMATVGFELACVLFHYKKKCSKAKPTEYERLTRWPLALDRWDRHSTT